MVEVKLRMVGFDLSGEMCTVEAETVENASNNTLVYTKTLASLIQKVITLLYRIFIKNYLQNEQKVDKILGKKEQIP